MREGKWLLEFYERKENVKSLSKRVINLGNVVELVGCNLKQVLRTV